MAHLRPLATRGCARQAGFTLIEVLVVVAIIALLVSILLPSLTQAREQAKVAACLANLKGIGTAMGGYLNMERNRFPWRPVLHRATNSLYEGTVRVYSNYHGGKRGIGDPPNGPLHVYYQQGGEYDFLASERPLNRYVATAKLGKDADLRVFSCPADAAGKGGGIASRSSYAVARSKTSGYDSCGTSYQSNVTWYSYVLNREVSSPPTPNFERNKRVRQLLDRIVPIFEKLGAARAIMMHEDPSDCALGGVLADYPLDWKVPGYHKKDGYHSMMFLDGHAANVSIVAKMNLNHKMVNGRFVECNASQAMDPNSGCTQGTGQWIARQNHGQE